MSADKQDVKRKVSGLYNLLYPDYSGGFQIENITDSSVEAHILLPEVGINLDMWEDWPVEKQLEVLIHEFAHTENYEDNHSPEFWDRVVNLVHKLAENQSEAEDIMDESFDINKVRNIIVRSVHVDVVEDDESVQEQKRELQQKFAKQKNNEVIDIDSL